MSKLPITVIVPTKNAERTIETCLLSLFENNPSQLVIVDGGSTDKTIEIVSKFTKDIFFDQGRGPAFAHQLGAEKASQEYIAYVDGDIILPPKTLEKLLADLEESDCITMQATISGGSLSTYWEKVADWRLKIYQKRYGGMISAVVLKKKNITKYGFDSNIIYAGDDYDFERKVRKGKEYMGTSSAVVYHYHCADLKSLFKQSLRNGRAAIYFIRKYGPLRFRHWPPLAIFYWFIVCLLKGKPHYIPFFFVDSFGSLLGMFKGVVSSGN